MKLDHFIITFHNCFKKKQWLKFWAGMINTLHNVCAVHWGCAVQYTGGISLSTPGGIQYIGRISWVHLEVFSTVTGYHEYTEGYHDEWGGISWVHWEMFSTLGFPYKFNSFPNDLPPHLSWYPPLYSWYPPGILNIPHCTAYLQCTAQTLCRVIEQLSGQQLVQYLIYSPSIGSPFQKNKSVMGQQSAK